MFPTIDPPRGAFIHGWPYWIREERDDERNRPTARDVSVAAHVPTVQEIIGASGVVAASVPLMDGLVPSALHRLPEGVQRTMVSPRHIVTLIPHGFTVLVEPDRPPDATDSGILLPEDRDHVATSGAVVAVGRGSKRLWDERQAAYQRAADIVYEYDPWGCAERIREVAMTPAPCPSVEVGQRVVFAAEAGLLVQDNGKPYILLSEDEIAIVIEESELAV